MRVKVRLYRPHDMDLIILKKTESYRLAIEMKQCLIAYATGSAYTPPEFDFDEAPDGYIGKNYQMHIELNPKKQEEKAAIDVLKEIRPGYRCAFIKTLFRSNCVYLPLLVFADNSALITSRADLFYKMTKDMNKSAVTETKETKDSETPKKEQEIKGKEKAGNINIEETDSNESEKNETEPVDTSEFDSLFNSLSSLG